jgi:DNA polymerase I
MLQDKGIEMKAGDLVSFVKIKPRQYAFGNNKEKGKEITTNVMPVQYATNGEVDVDKYVAYLQSTFDQVLDALGLEFEEIIGLTRLERFM